MVGVPGRSQACNTCRQRRIACSRQKPQCAQCIKSNRVCSGYQRERIFIVSHGTNEEPSKTYTKPTSDETENRASWGRNNYDTLLVPGRKPRNRSQIIRTPAHVSLESSICPHAAYRQQVLNAFLDCYLPVAELGSMEDKPWISLLPDLPNPSKALETSTLAICTASLGRLHNDAVLIRESLRLYTRGLSELQYSLWDPTLMYRDDTLGACMALTMYELMECPAQTKYGYVSHHNGCARLIELRGPKAHSSGISHQIFVVFRTQAIFQALEHHRSTYLSDSSWTNLPWDGVPKRPIDRIFDFITLAPEIFKEADRFNDLDSKDLLPAVLGVVKRCWTMDAELQQFYDDLERNTLGPLYWPEFSAEDSPADDPVSGKVFPVSFRFSNLRTAGTLMLYWATLVMLWNGLGHLYRVLPNIPVDKASIRIQPVDSPCTDCSGGTVKGENCSCKDEAEEFTSLEFEMSHLRPLDHRADIVSVARNVCQCVEYCLQDEMLGAGPTFVIAPLAIVVETLKDNPGFTRELQWIKAALDKVHSRGMRFVQYFGNSIMEQEHDRLSTST